MDIDDVNLAPLWAPSAVFDFVTFLNSFVFEFRPVARAAADPPQARPTARRASHVRSVPVGRFVDGVGTDNCANKSLPHSGGAF